MAKRPPPKRPLDDPRWRPLAEAHAYRAKQSGDAHAAASDLTAALHEGRLPFKLIRLAPAGEKPKAELGDPLFWNERRVGSFPEGMDVVFRQPQTVGKLTELADTAVFVWWPVYKNIFAAPSTVSQLDAKIEEVPKTRDREPTYDYRKLGDRLAVWLGRNNAVAGLKGVRKLAEEFEVECDKRSWEVPGHTQLRAYLTNVIGALRTPPKSPKRR